jgi:hypothetical protein
MLFSVSISENPSFIGELVGRVEDAVVAGGAGAAAEPKAPATEAGALGRAEVELEEARGGFVVVVGEEVDVVVGVVVDEGVGIDVDVGVGIDVDVGVGIDVDEGVGIDVDVGVGIDVDEGVDVGTTVEAPPVCLVGFVVGLVNPSYNPKLLVLKAIIISNTKTTPKILLQ